MMNKKQLGWLKRIALLGISPMVFGLAGCALTGGNGSTTPTPTPTPTPSVTGFVQVERLGRPAINEGLIISNANLNLWNSIPPTSDLDGGAAALALRAEAIATVAAIDPADGVTGNTTPTDIALAFLPDVMRVDTSIDTMNVSDTAYSFSLVNLGTNAHPTPVSGRKIEDDVVDITLTVLSGGALTVSDNVSYTAPVNPAPGFDNPGLGHTELSGQSGALEEADFPFLARPR
jgi:hypothetical protein